MTDPATGFEPGSPPVEPTGHVRIDRVLERLERLDEREITDHPQEYDAIHLVLRESLASAGQDEDPAGSA